jgi:1-acyl-sn-glycerol-3-phosphate acyltransferase
MKRKYQIYEEAAIYGTEPRTIHFFSRAFPTVSFYMDFLTVVLKAAWKAKRGVYGDDDWCESSINILHSLESVGVEITITGIDSLRQLTSPCVIIGNHMSVLETVVLPIIIHPIRPMVFIVKQSLLTYPVFKHVMRARNPISVGRTNPRQDYKIILDEGKDRLQKGISVVVFPQRTRSTSFDPAQFNSIGVKLAKNAGVPVVPLALLTDAWENGKYLKEFGSIHPSRKVHFCFGEPIQISGSGNAQHKAAVDFICGKLGELGVPIKKNAEQET